MTDEDTPYDVTRRRLLRTTGVVGIAGLAGCLGDGGGGGGGGTPTEDETATDTGTATDTEAGTDAEADVETETVTETSGEETTGGETTTGGGGGTPSQGQLKLAQVKAPIEFDPIVLNDVPSDQVSSLIFDTLYTWNEEGTDTVPQIAAGEPEVENGGQRYIVEIDGDATFQNGDPVTAEDVAYSFTAPVEEETENAASFNMIDTAEPVDEATVQFDLKYPFGAFDSYLAAYVVPKSVREEDKEAFNTSNPVGAGPFTFDAWEQGSFARVSRWDDYWGDPMPNLSQVEFVPVEEGTTRVTTLRSGDNDVIEQIPPKSWSTVEGMGNASIDAVPGVGYFYLAFNCQEGPTADPQVREAIDYAVSMDQAVSNFVEPTGLRQYSPLPEVLVEGWDMPIEDWKEIAHEKDVDQAKSLLDDSDNVPDDWTAKIIVPPDDKREQIGVSVANGLGEAGYDANVQRLDWGTFLNRYVTGDPSDYNMYTLGWSGTPDPDSFMYFLFAQSQAGVNHGHFYQNDEVNSAIVDARESTDRDERKELYRQAITTILEDRVNLPAYNLKNSFGVKNYVNDFTAHSVGSFTLTSDYNNVSIDR